MWNPGSKAQTDWFKPSDRLQFETVIACGDSCGCSSVGRAPRCQRGCRGFESLHPLFFIDFGLRRSGTGPETSAAAVSLLTLDVYSRSELACCLLRLFPQRRSIRPSELPGIACSSPLCRAFNASNAFYAIRTESGTPANYSQVAQSFAPGAVAVHARICYHHRK